MQIREIMTEKPACCTPETSLREVAQMMVDNDCGLIPVVDSHSTMKPVGTITDRDITIRTVAVNQNPLDQKASDIMTTRVINITPEMSVEECFNVMEDREIRRILVVDENGACCGIVAQADIAQLGMNPERTAKYLREVSESSPSPNTGQYFGRRLQNFSSQNESYINTNSLLPLFLGLGAGAALMYYFSPERKTDQTSQVNYSKTDYQPNARHDVNTRHLNETSTDTARNTQEFKTETNNSIADSIKTRDEEDTFVKGSGKTRSASQS